MRRLRRREHKQGLVEDRRRLVRRYLDGAEPQQASSETPLPTEESPDLVPSPALATPTLPPTEHVAAALPRPEASGAATEVEPHRPLTSEPLQPAAFEGAIRTLEEVVRLCEQVASLGRMRLPAEGRLDRRG
ncbi:MAG TPA: hypothetical protein VFU64_04285 [Gaiellaceae bacterium]|nr:hypothetical protein [Gaiellaceae bacterium]